MSDRCFDLAVNKTFLQGKIYDILKYPFFKSSGVVSGVSSNYAMQGSVSIMSDKYVKMSDRRPSVKHAIASTTVDKSVSLLFGEGRFPIVAHEDEETSEIFNDLSKSIDLEWHMVDCATKGSIGSGILFLKVIDGEIFVCSDWSCYYTPFFKKEDPTKLEKVLYTICLMGYEIKELNLKGVEVKNENTYIFMREWNETQELLYEPIKLAEYQKMQKNGNISLSVVTEESITHGLGFVPIIWIKNLPGGDTIDGVCTFANAMDDIIELDYQMSQAGRGLKYSSEPILSITGGFLAAAAQTQALAPGDVLMLDENGEAKHVEISGDACNAALAFCKQLRDIAIENIHGDRTNPEKLHAMQSGKAMEMLQMSLVWLASKLRLSYGEYALKMLFKMISDINKTSDFLYRGKLVKKGSIKDGNINLKWGSWFDPTASDRLQDAQTLALLRQNNLLSTKTAVSSISAEYDISDIDEEMSEIDREKSEEDAKNEKMILAKNKNSQINASKSQQ